MFLCAAEIETVNVFDTFEKGLVYTVRPQGKPWKSVFELFDVLII